ETYTAGLRGRLIASYFRWSMGSHQDEEFEFDIDTEWRGKWIELRTTWHCGTVTGDFASVASDGWFKVEASTDGGVTFTTMIHVTGIDLYMWDGWDQTFPGHGIGYNPALKNHLNSLWFGFYGLADTTNIWLYNDYEGIGEEDLPILGAGDEVIDPW